MPRLTHNTLNGLFILSLLSVAGSSPALNLANKPLFLSNGSVPNVALMLDNSGSMDWEILTGRHFDYCSYATNSSCSNPTTDGLFYPNYSAQYRYLYSTSSNAYSNTYALGYTWDLTNTNDFVVYGTKDWRIFSKDLNVVYFDPVETYTPWVSSLPNASFTSARAHPISTETGYNSTRDLTGSFYVLYQDTAGFSGSYPTNSGSSYTSGPNGQVDYWDDHTIIKINSDSISRWEVTFSVSGGNVVRTVSAEDVNYDQDEVAAVQQNYANWYQYYRRRAFSINSAVSDLLASNPNYRYSMGLINGSGTPLVQVADNNNDLPAHNDDLLNTLFEQNQQALGTPLRRGLDRVGAYLSTSGAGAPITESCQQNFSVLFSDGYWNGSLSNASIGNSDGDGYSPTVADVADYYYKNDLRGDLDDNVPPSAADPATHQHMSTFTVAFGLEGKLSDSDSDGWPDSGGQNLASNGNWGDPFSSDPSKIDDLWHAAFNSKGEYTSAKTPTQVVDALSNALAEIDRRVGSAASVATNSGSLRSGTQLFQARFNSSNWTGDIRALPLNSDGSVSNTPSWEASTLMENRTADSRVIITADMVGNVLVGKPFRNDGDTTLSGSFSQGMDTLGIQGRLSDYTTALVNYIRGDDSNANNNSPDAAWSQCAVYGATCTLTESQTVRYGLNDTWSVKVMPAGQFACDESVFTDSLAGDVEVCQLATTQNYGFRSRASKLADFIHSTPIYVGPPISRYTDDSYQTFKSDNASRTPVIYVGGNGGMLHAFRATDGAEVLGFVPHYASTKLHELAKINYEHVYYVDGEQTAADVFIDTDGEGDEWKTILVGAMRGGGEAVYALDITDPASFSEDNADDIFLWEFSPATHTKMGHSFGKPLVAKMANGQWVVIVANGYNSNDGTAVLYILDAATGEPLTDGGVMDTMNGDPSSPNGLSSPTAVDTNQDGLVDYIYAGDLNGNLWKFNVDSSDPKDWGIAYNDAGTPLPLFSAGSSSPITVAPAVGRHPTKQGYLVYFGTGKYLETIDNQSTGQPVQGFFAIWDELYANTEFPGPVGGGDLLGQFITAELELYPNDTNNDGVTNSQDEASSFRVTSSNRACWDECGTGNIQHRGWVLALQVNNDSRGERQVTQPILRNGRIIFTTLMPSESSCTNGGKSWLMELSAADGSYLPEPPFDINQDDEFDEEDKNFTNWTTADLTAICPNGQCPAPSGILNEGVVQTPSIIGCFTGVECKYLSGSTGGIGQVNENPGGNSLGRQSWRELRGD
ncbi:pilus assembly protein [Parendozoicomonas haliclonae]|uniref:Neisseria PilC protein n=1 Tax=Parendozoicomonas haliclonae TaxID=1960125 RepID=A0A1X7AQE5_9GAMM|nr:PilC/PilY family type IV pilus protein [Parendozoicomonas haliclonae]SMA50373.1 Neisseria PilC protein [Parendozoicomonas haliclonae]